LRTYGRKGWVARIEPNGEQKRPSFQANIVVAAACPAMFNETTPLVYKGLGPVRSTPLQLAVFLTQFAPVMRFAQTDARVLFFNDKNATEESIAQQDEPLLSSERILTMRFNNSVRSLPHWTMAIHHTILYFSALDTLQAVWWAAAC
jgi:hypothetical protein